MMNDKFGKLTVLEDLGTIKSGSSMKRVVKCRCDCGVVKDFLLHKLKSLQTKSCGCLKHDKTFSKDNLIGKKFGRLTVVAGAEPKVVGKTKKRRKAWQCVCSCGKITVVTEHSLKTGNTSSCGCFTFDRIRESKFNDLTNRKFGRLTVKKFIRYYKKHVDWECECDCGRSIKVRANNLLSGTTKSCGCLFVERFSKHGLSGNHSEYRKFQWTRNPTLRLAHQISNAVRGSFKKKQVIKDGRTFKHIGYTSKELKEHLESLWEPWMNWENYGGNMNDPRKTWHIDHVIPQSRFPYTSISDPLFRECWCLSNLRPLEKIENIKKGDA